MLETFLTAFTTFFAVIGPIEAAVLLASITPNMTRGERRTISVKAVIIATVIILLFALVGEPVLRQLGVSLPALQVAGGLVLFIIALDMTLSRRPGLAPLTSKESEEAETKAERHAEIAVFPCHAPTRRTLILLLLAQEVHQLIGVTARKVIVRVFGVLLAALAVQSIFNGLAESRIFG